MNVHLSSLFKLGACVLIALTLPPKLEAQQLRERFIGRKVGDFSLPMPVTDTNWSLSEQAKEADAVILYFLSTECPVTNRNLPTLNELSESDWDAKNVIVVGINSNVHETSDEIEQHSIEYDLKFPVLYDANGDVARQLGVNRTGEAILLNGGFKIRYRGVIDDRFERGVTKPRATKRYLTDALTATLGDRMPSILITPVEACPLNLASRENESEQVAEPVTYAEHAAIIIQQNCQTCHRPGGVGPFELMTFEDARSWSTSIREVITLDLMPPWHADAPHGFFVNDRSLTDDEYSTLLDWIDDGALEGDTSKLPAERSFPDSWTIGTPDLVVRMEKTVEIPAATPELGVPYKYIWAGEPFEEETWIKSAEVRPGASAVVHHATAYIVPEGIDIELVNDERPGEGTLADLTSPINDLPFLVAFVPGDNAFVLKEGLAKRVPKGARILFEMHYTPNGRRQSDRTELGLVFAKEPPAHEVLSNAAINYWFSIPPGTANHRVTARSQEFNRDSVLLSMNPHMHYRGKSFQYELVKPSGDKQVLLHVPNYRFDWQTNYWLAEPVVIPRGSYIQCTAIFDNSEDNPFNPDPTVRVNWGEQTWQEMVLAGFEYYEE